ncbi:MAG: hypothetical protein QY326_08305 [Bdellovibrionota bacterium]|nr:MAG: hypothetical protein QY326_08305 [Bdellovibrionota bacterium]
MAKIFAPRPSDLLADHLDGARRFAPIEFMFPGTGRAVFAAEGSRGGGGGGAEPEKGAEAPREAAPPKKWGLRRAAEIAQAYRELQLNEAQIVSTIPPHLFATPDGSGALPQVLADPQRWSFLARPHDDSRPYLHYYLNATEGDWSYSLRWHTPTPRGAWADSLPTCSLERRWAHYVELPGYRPHEVLIQNLASSSPAIREQLSSFLITQLGPTVGAVVFTGAHGWIPMQGYQLLLALHPRGTEWVRSVRDLTHWAGHPPAIPVPQIVKDKGE